MVRKEKFSHRENEIYNVSADASAKSLWNLVKRRACWSKSLALTMLKTGENEFLSSLAKMASALNNYFVNKVKNICSSLQPCKLDPTATLKKLMRKWKKLDRVPTFEFKKIDQHTVRKLILSSKN